MLAGTVNIKDYTAVIVLTDCKAAVELDSSEANVAAVVGRPFIFMQEIADGSNNQATPVFSAFMVLFF